MAIEFTNKPIYWLNKGTAPSENLRRNGFQAGYKPPAAVFNNQWHTTDECIDELQTKLSGVDDKADTKVDKVSGKSLIDENIATYVTYNTEDHSLYTPPIIATTIYGDITLHKAEETHNLSEKANTTDVLAKTNTTEFTPTGDYNPATKKYVDDKVGSITVPIIDNLESDSTTSALSAKQGKVLDTAIAAKVDKVEGKGLSTNDYTDSEKAEVAKIKDKVDKVSDKGLSSNDFTDTYKSKLDNLDTNLSAKAAKTDVLTKTNTATFTPTGNYQPATKKYVDDNVKSKVVNGSSLSTLTLTVSSTIPTTLAAGTICFIPEA